MNKYVLVTDSSCDLSEAMVRELDLSVLPLSFHIGENSYKDHPDRREMDPKDFYDRIRSGAMPTTSAVNPEEYIEHLTPFLEQGQDVLVLAFSSGLSTTCQSAQIAAAELSERYPERKLLVVDTLCASMGQGLLCWHAAQKRLAGESMEAVRDWCEENKLRLSHWFTVDDLMHLKRGGRVSAATAVVGTMLQIKPVLHVDDEGRLINVSKARGRRASLDALVSKAGELATEPAAQRLMLISHSDCETDAQYVADQIKEKYGVQRIELNNIGPVIGSHTGPGCVALFFLGQHRSH